MDSGRDRDAQGRPSSARPRDALGRPLAFGAEGVTPLPPVLPQDAQGTLSLARALLRAERPFQAHEVLEERWKSGPVAERDLWQGLAQACVAMTHRARGNETGALTLATRAAQHLARYEGQTHGVPLADLQTWLEGGGRGVCPLLD